MKQLIVLVASVVLGVSIGGIVLGFRTTATELGSAADNGLSYIAQTMSTAAIQAKGQAE
ncbi:MAG: hypothetical protein Q4E99_02675 [Bacillota bacterium]|nr:hypothetical protein [Bacillota bacterium]